MSLLPVGPVPSLQALGSLSTALGALPTTTRASSKYCANSNGSMVLLGNNTPCVDPNGVNIENAATNVVLQSEAFDNASWTKTSVTVTANSATSPAGTLTADTLHSTVNGGLVQSASVVGAASHYSASGWAWTASGTQSFDVVIYDVTTTAALKTCVGIKATVSSNTANGRWTCSNSSAPSVLDVVVLRIYPGQTTGQGTVIAWGAQLEATPYVSTYIPTTTLASTRALDAIAAPVITSFTMGYSMSADVIPTYVDPSDNSDILALMNGGSNQNECVLSAGNNGGVSALNWNGSHESNVDAPGHLALDVRGHVSCSYDKVNIKACVNGGCATAPATFNFSSSLTPFLGYESITGDLALQGWLSNICFSPNPSGCQ